MSLVRRFPFDEMHILRNQIDSVFDGNGRSLNDFSLKQSFPVEITETPEAYLVNLMVPGIPPKQIQVDTSEKELSVMAETQPRELSENENIHLNEFQYGKFSRRFKFPLTIDTTKVEANYSLGMLRISLPKSEAVQPKRIAIHVNQALTE